MPSSAKTYLFIAAAVTAAVICYFQFFHESREDRVLKTLYELSENIEKHSEENPLISAKKARNIAQAFADNCIIDIPFESFSRTVSSRDISDYALLRRSRFKTLSLNFQEITVSFPDKTTAQAGLTAILNGTQTGGKRPDLIYDLVFTLEKAEAEESGWQISRIEVMQILEEE